MIEDSRQALDILRWWADAGVDVMMGEAPRDRFAEAAAPPPPLSPPR